MHSFLKTLKHKLMYSEYCITVVYIYYVIFGARFHNSKDNFHMFLLNIENVCDT